MSIGELQTTRQGALRCLDWLERACIAGLYGWLALRIYHETSNAANYMLLASEGLVVVFILIRRSTNQVSLRSTDWLLAATATIMPLLAAPNGNGPLLSKACLAMLMLCGLMSQISAKIALGRSFGCLPAHRGLVLRGPYRFVRHPIYAGYLLTHLAWLAINPSFWNLGIYGVAYLTQIPRLLAEERLLSVDPHYQSYMAAVRYRLVPGLY